MARTIVKIQAVALIGAMLLAAGATRAEPSEAADRGERNSSAGAATPTPRIPVKAHDQSHATSQTAAKAPFEGPFPQRTELFVPPDRPLVIPKSAPREGPKVEFKGFARTDSNLVLLSIDGQLVTAREGDAPWGIQIVEISPPRVVLKRGTHRWTESLYTLE